MTLAELLASFRDLADDRAAPYLWGDERVAAWLNEACREAAVRARLIPAELSRHVAAGQESLAVPEEWFDVDSVYDIAGGRLLSRAWPEDLPAHWQARSGPLESFVDQRGRIRLYPIPRVDASLAIAGFSLPFFTLCHAGDEPEIPVHLHAPLVYWALHRAYQVQDADQGDGQKSAMFLDLFGRAFGEAVDANVLRKRRERRRHLVRMVEYV